MFLGLDTSNYTTSAAAYDPVVNTMRQEKRLLPVREGEMGLRQSDAVFHHVRQLPDVLEALLAGNERNFLAVGVSDRPRETEGSYMPCFLAGLGAARELSAVLRIPYFRFTHQQGHVAAALFGSGRLELFEREFIAFHLSGGTTEALAVCPDGAGGLCCRLLARSLDLKAGQLIDRVGAALGLPFPAGHALEQMALKAKGRYAPKASMDGMNCHLSGAENQCRAMLERGEPQEETALFCLMQVLAAVEGMTKAVLQECGKHPLLYAGGVMSNSLLRNALQERYGGFFAPPSYSADNAAGIALLCSRRV